MTDDQIWDAWLEGSHYRTMSERLRAVAEAAAGEELERCITKLHGAACCAPRGTMVRETLHRLCEELRRTRRAQGGGG